MYFINGHASGRAQEVVLGVDRESACAISGAARLIPAGSLSIPGFAERRYGCVLGRTRCLWRLPPDHLDQAIIGKGGPAKNASATRSRIRHSSGRAAPHGRQQPDRNIRRRRPNQGRTAKAAMYSKERQ